MNNLNFTEEERKQFDSLIISLTNHVIRLKKQINATPNIDPELEEIATNIFNIHHKFYTLFFESPNLSKKKFNKRLGALMCNVEFQESKLAELDFKYAD